MRQIKISCRIDSIFGIRYFKDGEMVMFKMRTVSPLAEYKARSIAKDVGRPVEIWHYPEYGPSIKLCEVIK